MACQRFMLGMVAIHKIDWIGFALVLLEFLIAFEKGLLDLRVCLARHKLGFYNGTSRRAAGPMPLTV